MRKYFVFLAINLSVASIQPPLFYGLVIIKVKLKVFDS